MWQSTINIIPNILERVIAGFLNEMLLMINTSNSYNNMEIPFLLNIALPLNTWGRGRKLGPERSNYG